MLALSTETWKEHQLVCSQKTKQLTQARDIFHQHQLLHIDTLSFYIPRKKEDWGVLLCHGAAEVVFDQHKIVQGLKKGQTLL